MSFSGGGWKDSEEQRVGPNHTFSPAGLLHGPDESLTQSLCVGRDQSGFCPAPSIQEHVQRVMGQLLIGSGDWLWTLWLN